MSKNPEAKEKAIALRKEGLSPREIGERLGFTRGVIYHKGSSAYLWCLGDICQGVVRELAGVVQRLGTTLPLWISRVRVSSPAPFSIVHAGVGHRLITWLPTKNKGVRVSPPAPSFRLARAEGCAATSPLKEGVQGGELNAKQDSPYLPAGIIRLPRPLQRQAGIVSKACLAASRQFAGWRSGSALGS